MTYAAAIEAALAKGSVRLCLFFRFDFAAAPYRAWTGAGDIEIAGETWKGHGALAGLPELEQLLGGQANRLSIEASGVNDAVLAAALAGAAEVQGRDLAIGFVLFDSDGQPIAGAAGQVLQALDVGAMDRVTLTREGTEGGALRSVALEVASPMAARSTASLAFYSDTDQQLRHPGDKGCERATLDVVLTWPDF